MSRERPGYQRPTKIPDDIASRKRGYAAQGRGSGGYRTAVSIQGGGASAQAFAVAPPYVTKPPNGVDFQDFGTVAGVTSASGAVLLASFQVPSNDVAVIRTVSILANGLLTTSDIVWSFRFDGNTVTGWDALTINPRAAGSVEVTWSPEETYIHVPEGALVELVARVNDGGTYQLSGSFHGWHYGVALSGLSAAGYP